MPLHLEPVDVFAKLGDFSSLLIVSCPVCPPVSLAMQKGTPFIELFKNGIKTGAFERYVKEIRKPLEQRGVRTGVFSAYVPCPTMCLWTQGQRDRLLKRAKDYEAVLVLGCNSATLTTQQALKDTDCQIVQGMRMTGLTNATVSFQFPLTVNLEQKARVSEGEDVERVTL